MIGFTVYGVSLNKAHVFESATLFSLSLPTLSPVIWARVSLSSRAMRWSRAEKRRPSQTHTASLTPWPLLVGYFLCWAIMSHCTADKTELQGPQSHSPSIIFASWNSCLTRPQEVPWTNLPKLSKLRICMGPPHGLLGHLCLCLHPAISRLFAQLWSLPQLRKLLVLQPTALRLGMSPC